MVTRAGVVGVFFLLMGCQPATGSDLVACDCNCGFDFAGNPRLPIVGRACASVANGNVAGACGRVCAGKLQGMCLIGICPSEPACGTNTTAAITELPMGSAPRIGGDYVINGCSPMGPPGTGTAEGGHVGASRATIAPSSIISVLPFGADFAPQGEAQASAGQGQFALTDLVAALPLTVSVLGSSARDGHVYLSEPAFGTIDPSGNYEIPPGVARFLMNAVVDGNEVAFRGVNSTPISGHFDETSARFTLSADIAILGSGQHALADLTFDFVNRPPIAVITGSTEVECSQVGGATATLRGDQSLDPDGNISSFLWVVAPGTAQETRHTGPTLQTTFPLGETTVRLFVGDTVGSVTGAETTVRVVDSTGPELIGSRDTCLWPPNHKLAFLTYADLGINAVDRCTGASASIVVDSITSDEADNGLGDGNTALDSRVGANGVCLRSERSGRGDGRTYSILVHAIDPAGNLSTNTVTVLTGVAHDSRGGRCRDDVLVVADDDPRCAIPPPQPSPQGTATSRSALGCAATFPDAVFALLVLLFRRHGRQR